MMDVEIGEAVVAEFKILSAAFDSINLVVGVVSTVLSLSSSL